MLRSYLPDQPDSPDVPALLRHRFRGRALPGRRRLVAVRGLDKARKERMRVQRLRLEFRMELHGEVPRVAGQLRDLDELAVGGASRNAQAVLGERPLVQAVELV